MDLNKEADMLERIAVGVEGGISPAASGGALRAIAERLRAESAPPAPPAAAPGGAPADGTAGDAQGGSPADQIGTMTGSCEECRATVAGSAPAHDTDMMRHSVEGHGSRLAALLEAARAVLGG